ncbi:hypothetical protein EUGRSUZ_F02343 [Eucalyptus grandis]|uniref:Uncharacterized protein n=2 Tax=Eucalyptus grandis TaxID=71139 RepID=A0ACC3KHN9_EUCGR|nr:hypothetical protein EUGRSUZ_F02343 [Eucalyptus grandis]
MQGHGSLDRRYVRLCFLPITSRNPTRKRLHLSMAKAQNPFPRPLGVPSSDDSSPQFLSSRVVFNHWPLHIPALPNFPEIRATEISSRTPIPPPPLRFFQIFELLDSLRTGYASLLVDLYSPVQLFDVVAAVDLCQDFVPWCQRLEILNSYPDGSFDAELEIGFKFLEEGYVSHVELKRPRTVSQSTLFDHPINIWQFNSGPVPGSCSCSIYFLVDFKFQSPLYRQVASMLFREVVSRLVGSFSERCCLMYGPGVPIQEDIYGQRA